MGGSIEAIKTGFFQDEILRNAYQHQLEVEEKEKIVVGVNEFETDETMSKDILKIDTKKTKNQVERIKKLKKSRNNDKVTTALNNLENCSQSNNNLMPVIIECVESYATLGEISDTLRNTFGTYHEGDF